MSQTALKIFQAVKPHLPMIKFWKGGLIIQAATVIPETVMAPVAAAPPAATEPSKWQSDKIQNLEWWQTPLKFKKRDVDIVEIDQINSGGADNLYQ